MKILVTGFEAFGRERVNPAGILAERLSMHSDEYEIVSRVLPVSFGRAPREALRAVEALRPEAVLCLGQAGGIDRLHLERAAVNVANAKNPDNDGARPCQQAIIDGAPRRIETSIDVDALVAALSEEGVPSSVSESAGLYVCNTLYFSLLQAFPALPILFVHLPYLPEQAAARTPTPPSLPLAKMQAALTTLIHHLKRLC